ncbi:Uncharacterised protein [Escherichia coli]|uniref:Uncharacterized protein n=1 Tax=Escherichia coli TaxID=562 RepID=A0A377AAL0_ECOLX|nr:Uncharacterised protein [Escherichia coli]
MHPLTHPLPVTAHALLLDNGILTPARASVNGTTRTSDQDFESVYAHYQSENASELTGYHTVHSGYKTACPCK